MTTLVSRCLSAAGIRFLGILSRPGLLPLLRSAYRATSDADPSEVSVFRTRETRPGPGALSTPGTAVPAQLRVNPAAAACRLATAGPCHPGTTTRPGMSYLTRHQQGFTGVRPSRPFPSPVIPGRNRDPWALPWAPHPAEQDPAAHARAGTSLRHWPGITPSPSATSLSGPTHRERPHVATHQIGALSAEMIICLAAIIIPGQSGTYRHLQDRLTGLLAESGQKARSRECFRWQHNRLPVSQEFGRISWRPDSREAGPCRPHSFS
jgi:hypothetical protein